jgi:hypothetical protein
MTITFREVLDGTIRLRDEPAARPLRLDLRVEVVGRLRPRQTSDAVVSGRLRSPGWADDPRVHGTLEISPLERRRIRYRLDFTTVDGRSLHLDGWKSPTPRHPFRSMTELPATVTDPAGVVVGEATLRFRLARDLGRFLGSFRFGRHGAARPAGAGPAGAPHLRPRWRGQPGRLEVWYTTVTDPVTGTGLWFHHELVAPTGGGEPHAHGWAAVFPPDGPPVLRRFGPAPFGPATGDVVFDAAGVQVRTGGLSGTAGDLSWRLTTGGGGPPLFTFPRWAWEREALPAAHLVPAPGATFTGTVRAGDRELALAGAAGATGRIYGHGNARRWAWLHADLGGGEVLELVSAVSTRPVLRALPPLTFLRLRTGGSGGADWPPRPLAASLRLRARIGLPRWTVTGRVGDRRIRVEVSQPEESTVAVDYADPDGAPAVCHNCERASAVIVLQRRQGGRWTTERSWELAGTAHAEVGTREPATGERSGLG